MGKLEDRTCQYDDVYHSFFQVAEVKRLQGTTTREGWNDALRKLSLVEDRHVCPEDAEGEEGINGDS